MAHVTRSRLPVFALAIALLFQICVPSDVPNSGPDQQVDFVAFFETVDEDGDGQIEEFEVRQYIKENFQDLKTEKEVSDAVELLHRNLETHDDQEDTISENELEVHMKGLLQGHRVVEWVVHGLELPRYAEAFRENGITAYELPQLIKDGGKTLSLIGVTLPLHQQKIIRNIKRLMLGLGEAPGAPRDFHCRPVSCNSIKLKWLKPQNAGNPPLHKYVLERQKIWTPSALTFGKWEAVADVTSDETFYVDDSIEPGIFSYRLVAWNAYDRSETVVDQACRTDEKTLPCPQSRVSASSWLLGVCGTFVLVLTSVLVRSWHLQSILSHELSKVAEKLGLTNAAQALRSFGSGSFSDSIYRTWSRTTSSLAGTWSMNAGAALSFPGAVSLLGTRSGTGSLGAAWSDSSFVGSHVSPFSTRTVRPLLPHNGFGMEHANAFAVEKTVSRQTSSVGSEPGSQGDDEDKDPTHKKSLCSVAGCKNKVYFSVLHIKCLRSHYCGECQRFYCNEHTRISTHGHGGDCGVESKCVCFGCFANFEPGKQQAYLKINTLKESRKASIPEEKEGDGMRRSRSWSRGLASKLNVFNGFKSPKSSSNSLDTKTVSKSNSNKSSKSSSARRLRAQTNWNLMLNIALAVQKFKHHLRQSSRRSCS